MLLLNAGDFENLLTELVNGENPLALLRLDLREPLSVLEARLVTEDTLKEMVLDENLNVVLVQHRVAIIIRVVVWHIRTEQIGQLEDVLGGKGGQTNEVRLEILVCGADLLVSLKATILQDVVESYSLRFRLALAVQEAEALEDVDVNLVFRGTIIFMETRMEEQLGKGAFRVLEVCPCWRVELLSKGSESERALVACGFLLLLSCDVSTLDQLVDIDAVERKGLLELLDLVLKSP